MKTIRFKTSVNCMGCLAKVTSALDNLVGTGKWEVNLNDENKILSVETDRVDPQTIIETLKNLGYKAEMLD
ncbi:MAG: heavy-metal-associated domain-containing protein [Bacteroidales bacterium]|nr:heavy-metal-associated domain-containing protein [Bacteroidales bacterium]